MAHDQWRHDLRVAVTARDWCALERLLDAALPDDGLQHAGDAVIVALEADGLNAIASCARLVAALRERRWDGDEELGDAIEVAQGLGTSTLTRVPVELDMLAEALSEPGGSGGYVDLVTGEVWTESQIEYSDDVDADFDDRDRWLAVVGEGSDEDYRAMRRFIATVSDERVAQTT